MSQADVGVILPTFSHHGLCLVTAGEAGACVSLLCTLTSAFRGTEDRKEGAPKPREACNTHAQEITRALVKNKEK